MKLQHKNFFTRKKIIVATLAIVLIGGIGTYAFFATHTPTPQTSRSQPTTQNGTGKTNIQPATSQQVQAGENQKQDIINKDQTPSSAPANLTVTITAANQNNGTVNIRTLINSISNSGSCTLTITNGASTTTQSSATQALANSSTCKGFDVPVNSLPTGTWHITIAVAIDSSHGSVQKDIVVN